MPRIASFHLISRPPGGAVGAMAHLALDRRLLTRTPGLVFWRLLGTGHGRSTGPGADLRRTALFAVWESEDALDEFLAASTIAHRWSRADEAFHVRLHALAGHGSWRGVRVLDDLAHGSANGPIAVLTRAAIPPRHWRRFRASSRAISSELSATDGPLAVCGIGEVPIARLGTFSIWRCAEDVDAFARRASAHTDVISQSRGERWFGEELFARFQPYAATGIWNGTTLAL